MTEPAATFICEICGGEFPSDPTLEASLAECQQNLGFVPVESSRAYVCDGCYARFMEWYRKRPEQN